METCDVVVVGGGLGGLAAAAMLARGGKRVVLLERAAHLGGRARTTDEGGFLFNFGPHAVYRGGPAEAVLKDLGAFPPGRPPVLAESFAMRENALSPLPTSAGGLLTAPFLSWRERLETARFFATVSFANAEALENTTLDAWLDARSLSPKVRDLAAALFRISTYTADHARMSAGAAIRNLRRALKPGVVYVDGGWDAMTSRLARIASDAGAVVLTGASVNRVQAEDGRWIVDAGERRWSAASCVLAGSPAIAASLTHAKTLQDWAVRTRPVYAACLDVGLARLPHPTRGFSAGLDRPTYCSVHSLTARLAPDGAAVIHVAKYLPGEPESNDEAELEGVLDLLQPGWRDVVATRRFLPRMVVTNALVEAAHGGERGRPGPQVPGMAGLFVVGDWVGPEGQLLDAVLASARAASRAILAEGARAAA